MSKDKQREYQRKYQKANREQLNAYWRDYRKKNLEKMRADGRRRQKQYSRALRDKVFDILGDKCASCGFSDKRALQIDHINGGGVAHFRKRGTTGIMRDVINDSDPRRTYQILCANCNSIKRHEMEEYPNRVK